MKLLSTKIISKKFRDLLIKNNYQIDEKSFIKILPYKSISNISISENIIFTSKNSLNEDKKQKLSALVFKTEKMVRKNPSLFKPIF